MPRRLLSLLTAAATLGAVVATSGAADAAVSPRAAFTALTTEGAPGSYVLGSGSKVFVGTDVAVTGTAQYLSFSAPSSSWTVLVGAPTDGTLAPGTYTTGRFADVGVARLDVFGDGRGCNEQFGSLVVHEVTEDAGTGAITSFAATYATACGAGAPPNVGELRFNSTIDYERFGSQGLGTDSAARTVTVTAAAETTFGTAVLEGQSPAPYRLGTDTCSGQTVAAGGTCTVAVLAHPRDVGGHAARLRLPSASGDRVVGLTVVGVDTPGGAYTPLPPQRVLDTRKATGVTTTTPIGAAKSIDVQVTGRKGVPSTGVSAVVLNVTAIFPTKRGYLTVYPSTQSRPTASSVNFQAGWVGANLVTVPIAAGGKVRIYNAAGSTHVAADVVGYYHSAASTVDPSATALGSYESVGPVRFVDTRTAEWGKQPLNGQSYLWQSVDFGDEFNARVQALAVNVTVVKPTRQGHLTAFDGDSWTIPATSTLNFAAGRTVPNMAIIKAGHCSVECEAYGTPIPRFGIYNASTGSAHVVVDIVGVYFEGEVGDWGWRFRSLANPKRFVDSRTGLGLPANLGGNQSRAVVAPTSVAGYNTMAVVTNTTAAQPSSTTVFTLWPNDGSPRPTVSNLNPYAGQVVSNMTITEVWTANDFRIHNLAGTAPVVIDAAGTMEYYPAFVPPADWSGPARATGSTDRPTGDTARTPERAGQERVEAR